MAKRKYSKKKYDAWDEPSEPEPEVADTDMIVEYWDMSERPWRIAYKGRDVVKAWAKYEAYKKSFIHVRKNF